MEIPVKVLDQNSSRVYKIIKKAVRDKPSNRAFYQDFIIRNDLNKGLQIHIPKIVLMIYSIKNSSSSSGFVLLPVWLAPSSLLM